MNQQVRYQVFVSSTYEDLRAERQQATQAILESGSFPSGMELFPASDDAQWELIKRVIEESDYYIVIVGGKYGSIGPNGKSYTEMEYDYAAEKQIPVLGFVKTDIDTVPAKFVEGDSDKRKLLDTFRTKVMERTCRKFKDPLELGMAVMKSLMHEARVRPRTGWVRADQAWSEEDRQREIKLQEEIVEAYSEIEYLKRMLGDGQVLLEEIPTEQLSQGSDVFKFTIMFRDEKKNMVAEQLPVSWDDIFKTIGPTMYGYIIRKTGNYNSRPAYAFEENLENLLRSMVIERAQGRKIEIQEGQVDSCVFQFKELGYIRFRDKKEDDGSVFRGVTLTDLGEKRLSLLKTARR